MPYAADYAFTMPLSSSFIDADFFFAAMLLISSPLRH